MALSIHRSKSFPSLPEDRHKNCLYLVKPDGSTVIDTYLVDGQGNAYSHFNEPRFAELFEKYSVDIIRDFHLEELPEAKRRAAICKFVSDPVPDTKVPPAHTTGGAIDLTLLDPEGRELPMGCGFDAFTDKTCAAYFEAPEHVQGAEDEQVRENRRLLYYAMIDAGFTNLPSEWWHYDYGDRFWAYYMRKPAIYEGVFTREEIHG